MSPMDEGAVYSGVGGDQAFFDLVEAFYRGVENDPPLRAQYPADLAPGKKHLAWFLIQRFGGPALFSNERGHPRLRMRHFPFVLDQAARDAWVRHMTAALDEIPAFGPYRDMLLEYFEHTATFLMNR